MVRLLREDGVTDTCPELLEWIREGKNGYGGKQKKLKKYMNGVQNKKNICIFAHQFIVSNKKVGLWKMFLHSDL